MQSFTTGTDKVLHCQSPRQDRTIRMKQQHTRLSSERQAAFTYAHHISWLATLANQSDSMCLRQACCRLEEGKG